VCRGQPQCGVCEVLLVYHVRAQLGTSVPLHRRVPSMRWQDLPTTVCTRFDFYPRTLEQLSHVHWPLLQSSAMPCVLSYKLPDGRWMNTQWYHVARWMSTQWYTLFELLVNLALFVPLKPCISEFSTPHVKIIISDLIFEKQSCELQQKSSQSD
jgi:hypothetical protein